MPHRSNSLSILIARNTFLNILTQVFTIGLALWAIPILVTRLSEQGFGLLSLIWIFIGYFTLLDFGFSRANTKFISNSLASGNINQIQKIVGTSLICTFILGVISAAIIVLLTPYLVHDLFTIQPDIHDQAKRAFVAAGIGVPFILVFGATKGLQMAAQRFDIVNLFQVFLAVVQWFGSVVLLWLGYGLEEIILLAIVARTVLAFVSLALLPGILPGALQRIYLFDWATFRRLFAFGGWITVSQIISPLFLYLDRIFIGMYLTLDAVTYYSVPQEALTRILVIPLSLTTTLFPAMSEQSSLTDKGNLSILYLRSVKYLSIIMVPLILGFLLFAQELVSLWLGKEFASNSILIFQILAVGLLFNSLAQIPTTVLHALTRPDITAKFHIAELPLVILLNMLLIPKIGVVGAALTWSFRVAVDALFLFIAAGRELNIAFPNTKRQKPKLTFKLLPALICAATAAVLLVSDITAKIAIALLSFCLYIAVTWWYAFDEKDRDFFSHLRTRMFTSSLP